MTQQYESGNESDITRENDILIDYDFKVSTVPPEGPAPRLDDLYPIDLEGFGARTVRGFNLTGDMTELL